MVQWKCYKPSAPRQGLLESERHYAALYWLKMELHYFYSIAASFHSSNNYDVIIGRSHLL